MTAIILPFLVVIFILSSVDICTSLVTAGMPLGLRCVPSEVSLETSQVFGTALQASGIVAGAPVHVNLTARDRYGNAASG
eukprot:scaffold383807_cov52-Prasinocladus_malaysianus.AAC.1